MPPKPTKRAPEPATAIRAELGVYGLWLEVERAPGTWEGVFLPTRTVQVGRNAPSHSPVGRWTSSHSP